MKTILLIILAFIASFSISFSQPKIEWAKCYGGNYREQAESIRQTRDGGYIIAGASNSIDGDISGNIGYYDYWIIKINPIGIIQWQKSLGGTNLDVATSIQQTNDGGYIIAGRTVSTDGNVKGNHGNYDYWIVKLDSNGNIQWQKCLGGSGDEMANSIQQTNDGGYIVSGWSTSNDGDVTAHHSSLDSSDYWIVKLDSIGDIQWQKSLGGSGRDWATSIHQTCDNGYIVAGNTTSNDGNNIFFNHGGIDNWIVKLDSIGNIQWQKCLGGSGDEMANSIQQTRDGGFIVAGTSDSNDGDVSGNHGDSDYWIVKLDSIGIIQWQKSFGGSDYDYACFIQQTSEGGFIVAGSTGSNDGDVMGNHGYTDIWIIKLSASGYLQWQKSLGGSNNEEAPAIQITSDGGYIIAGWTMSNNGDVSGKHSINDNSFVYDDYWIVKLSPDTITSVIENQINTTTDFSIQPNPANDNLSINIIGETEENYIMEIYNVQGVKIESYQGFNKNIQINSTDYLSGIYYVVLKTQFNTIAKPFVIIK